jgi:hypothetical protein
VLDADAADLLLDGAEFEVDGEADPTGATAATPLHRDRSRGGQSLPQLLELCVGVDPLLLQDVQNGVHNALVARATAQVPGELKTHARLIGLGQAKHDVARRGEHSRRAEAALQCVVARERLPQPSHDRVIFIAFDGGDFTAFAGHGEGDARARGLAVNEHRAGAADAVFAAEVRSRQV